MTENGLDQIEHIRVGVHAPLLIGAAADLQVSQETLFGVVHLPVTTAKRKVSRNELLDPGVTERLARIAQIAQFAAEVFGADDKARQWLSTNNLALGNATPLSMLDTEIGGREVERILQAIRYGMAA
jgi:putative toxin-antitoxin system antitoxin component (TIGR02293 family)